MKNKVISFLILCLSVESIESQFFVLLPSVQTPVPWELPAPDPTDTVFKEKAAVVLQGFKTSVLEAHGGPAQYLCKHSSVTRLTQNSLHVGCGLPFLSVQIKSIQYGCTFADRGHEPQR